MVSGQDDHRGAVEDDVNGLFERLGNSAGHGYRAFEHARLPDAPPATPPELPQAVTPAPPLQPQPETPVVAAPLRAVQPGESGPSPLMQTFQRLLRAQPQSVDGPLKHYFAR